MSTLFVRLFDYSQYSNKQSNLYTKRRFWLYRIKRGNRLYSIDCRGNVIFLAKWWLEYRPPPSLTADVIDISITHASIQTQSTLSITRQMFDKPKQWKNRPKRGRWTEPKPDFNDLGFRNGLNSVALNLAHIMAHFLEHRVNNNGAFIGRAGSSLSGGAIY